MIGSTLVMMTKIQDRNGKFKKNTKTNDRAHRSSLGIVESSRSMCTSDTPLTSTVKRLELPYSSLERDCQSTRGLGDTSLNPFFQTAECLRPLFRGTDALLHNQEHEFVEGSGLAAYDPLNSYQQCLKEWSGDLATASGTLQAVNGSEYAACAVLSHELPSTDGVSFQHVVDAVGADLDQASSSQCTQQHEQALDNQALRKTKQAGGKRKRALGFPCTHKNCTWVFKKAADLDHHINSTHTKDEKFMCPVKGCFKGQSRRTFPRIDKLKDHLQRMHQAQSIAECPHGCFSVSLITLFDLAIHGVRHSKNDRSFGRVFGAVEQAVASYCPISHCKSRRLHESLRQHVAKHLEIDGLVSIEDNKEAISASDMVLKRRDCAHKQHSATIGEPIHSTCSCEIIDILITCPICSRACDNFKDFSKHMDQCHLSASNESLKSRMQILDSSYSKNLRDRVLRHYAHMEFPNRDLAWTSLFRPVMILENISEHYQSSSA